jgi:hypothetical protein
LVLVVRLPLVGLIQHFLQLLQQVAVEVLVLLAQITEVLVGLVEAVVVNTTQHLMEAQELVAKVLLEGMKRLPRQEAQVVAAVQVLLEEQE